MDCLSNCPLVISQHSDVANHRLDSVCKLPRKFGAPLTGTVQDRDVRTLVYKPLDDRTAQSRCTTGNQRYLLFQPPISEEVAQIA